MQEKNNNKIARHGTIGMIAVVISAATAIIFIPPIIDLIGQKTYGIWAALAIFTGAGSLLDLGIPRAMTYYLGSAKRTKRNESTIFWTSASIIGIICSIILLALLLTSKLIHGSSFGWSDIPKEMNLPLIAGGAYLIMNAIVTATFRAYIEYHLKSHAIQVLALTFHLLNFGGIFLLAFLSQDAAHLILHTCAVTTIITLLHIAYCAKFLMLPKYSTPDVRIGKLLIKRSIGHLTLNIVNSLSIPINRYLVISFGGVASHTIFDIAIRVAIAATSVLQAFNLQVYGVVLRLKQTSSGTAIALAIRMTKITIAVYSLGIFVLYFTVDSIGTYLINDARNEFTTILFITIAGVATTGIAEPAMRTLWAWGLERRAALIRSTALLINILLIAFFVDENPALEIASCYSFSLITGSFATVASLILLKTKDGLK